MQLEGFASWLSNKHFTPPPLAFVVDCKCQEYIAKVVLVTASFAKISPTFKQYDIGLFTATIHVRFVCKQPRCVGWVDENARLVGPPFRDAVLVICID